MNLTFHIIFGGLAILFFLIEFAYKRQVYQLLFPLMLIISFCFYASESQLYHMILGMIALLVGIVALFFLRKTHRQEEEERKQQEQQLAKLEQEEISEETHEKETDHS